MYMDKPKVIVLLTTYNGEKFLKEQLDSVLNQKDVDVFLKVFDDISKDKTHEILENYRKNHKNFDYVINKTNKGFSYNFLDAYFSLKDEQFDYVAFADQDDVWLDDKLISAISLIKEKNHPNGCLYCSNLKLVDQDLNDIGLMQNESVLKLNKYNFLTDNIATGCTIVVNKAFYDYSTKYYPKDIKLHDYYLFLLAVLNAEYVYDYNCHILYRQHGHNEIGSNDALMSKSNLKKIKNPKHTTPLIHQQLLAGFKDDIPSEYLPYVEIIANYKQSFKKKMKLVFSRKIHKRKHNFIFKLLVLFGKY